MNNFIKKVACPILLANCLLFVPYPLVKADDTQPKEEVFYYLNDHLGGVDIVTDENGNVVERKDYLPYGEERIIDGEESIEDYGYTGKEQDTESGLYYYGARYYDPEIGRFIQIDPLVLGESGKPLSDVLSNPQALNGYSYVLNNPMRYVDEEGKYEIDVHYDLTYFLGSKAGLDFNDAFGIAVEDQMTDENPETSPWNPDPNARGKYHFSTPEQREELFKNAISTLDNKDIGGFMHAAQDKFSHDGYGTTLGHTYSWHFPDYTWFSPDRADAMSKDSFKYLRLFNRLKNGTGNLSLKDYNAETEKIWSSVEENVKNFNRSITLDDKLKSLYPELYNDDKKDEKEQNKAK